MALKGVASRKGGIETGLPNKKTRANHDESFKKKKEFCRKCFKDNCECKYLFDMTPQTHKPVIQQTSPSHQFD